MDSDVQPAERLCGNFSSQRSELLRPIRTAIILSPMPRFRLILVAVSLITSGYLRAQPGSQLLQVHFVDVGQGDAIWIQGPAGECAENGLNIIIDGGPNSGKSNRLITYLETYKFVKGSLVDYAIVTHPHDDHYPGMIDILKNYQVRTIIDSGFPDLGPKFGRFLTAAKAAKAGNTSSVFVQMRNQPNFQFADCTDLHMSILFGDTDQPGLGSGNSRVNNASTVFRIDYKNFSFLFLGDLEGKDRQDPADKLEFGEKALLGRVPAAKLRATVLKVGHH